MKNPKAFLFVITGLLFIISCTQPKSGGGDKEIQSEGLKQGQGYVQDGVSEQNVLQVAIGSADHSTLVVAVQAVELEHVLANNGPITVFAPNNDAFNKLPDGTVDNLLKPENKKTLANIITFHAAPGTYSLEDLQKETQLYQATGDYVKITQEDGKVLVNGANILASVDVANGYVHVIDQVLLPPEK